MSRASVSRWRIGLAVGAGALAATVAAACGVPAEGGFQQVEPNDIPYGLDETTVAPTTSTPTTVPESTTSTTTVESTTTIAVEEVRLYFVSGLRLLPTARVLVSPATEQQVVAALIDGPGEGDEFAGIRSALPDDSEMIVTVERGTARVELPPGLLTSIPSQDQRYAVAQIVLTLTRRPGIGQVVFTSGGLPQQVPRGGGDVTDEPVTFEDYQNLIGPSSA
jgi:spore germination protein GerM